MTDGRRTRDLRSAVRRGERRRRRSDARRRAPARARGADRARPARWSCTRPPTTSPQARSTRSTAASSSATTASSIPSSGTPGAARALHDRVPGTARDLGAARARRPAHAGDRPLREPPAARLAGDVRLRLGLSRPRRAAALVAAGAAGERSPRATAAARTRRRSSAARRCASCSRCATSSSRRRAASRDAAVELLAREPYDLAWLTFSAAHLAGHQFWDLSQLARGAGRARPGAAGERARGRLRGGRRGLRARARRAARRRRHHRHLGGRDGRQQLARRPAAADARGGAERRAAAGDGDGGAGAIWRLRAAIPPGARGAIAQALPDRAVLELTARLELRGIDWSQTPPSATPPTTRATSA